MSSSSAPASDAVQSNNRDATAPATVAVLTTSDFQVVCWAKLPRSRHSMDDPWRYTLKYYSFWDDQRFTHLDSLLTQLAPLAVIHVACTEKGDHRPPQQATQTARKKAKQVHDVLRSLQQMIATRTDLTMSNDDEQSDSTYTSLAQIHAKLPNHVADANRIDSTIEQVLLESSKLQFRGDVQLASHPWIRKALGFYLSAAEGWLQSGGVPDDVRGSVHVEAGVLDSHLLLDRTAAQCIHLLPPPNAGAATVVGGQPHNNSLLGILSQPCCTKMGKRLMEQWLRQPLVNLQAILYRQQAVATLVDDGVGRDQLRDEGLRNCCNIDISKLALDLGSYGSLSTGDDGDADQDDGNTPMGSTQKALKSLYHLYILASQKLPLLLDNLQKVVDASKYSSTPCNSDEEEPSLLETISLDLHKAHAELKRSQELVENILDLDMAPREFFIQTSFKEELADIKNELLSVDASVDECHVAMNELWAETNGMNVDSNHVRLEIFGDQDASKVWQFRLPDTNHSKVLMDGELKHHVKVHRLLKNGVYFSTQELRELSTKKQDLLAEYDRHQRKVVGDAMKVAATYQGTLERSSELIAQLDVLVSLGHVAAYNPHGYCRPTMTDGEEDGLGIKLEQARHPCVELQENVNFIPNDVELVFGESSFIILSGPNMGGKSTYIRAVGAIVALAQIGSYVPCASATINICHHILARVGAGDLQDRGISTFMAEMLEASSIIRTATKRSLIIIDELGRGTSTFDGYGLARAISEYIVQKIGCYTVFATHFHELTQLEEQEPAVKNCHVTAQTGAHGLTFLYTVMPGPCLESFGIQVAEMAQLPAVVIAEAKRRARQLENFDYRKKLRTEEESSANDGNADAHTVAEEASANLAFVRRFRKLPLNTVSSKEEKLAMLRALLAQTGQ